MITEIELAKALKDVLTYVVVSVNDCDGRHCGYPCCISCCGPENAQADASEAGQANSRACDILKEWENNMPKARKPGCNCEPSHWRNGVIPPVCSEYAGDGDEYCLQCEHDFECHQGKLEDPK